MLFLPVTRTRTMERVVASIEASDIPRKAIVLIDGPGCEAWPKALTRAGFDVECHVTGNGKAPFSTDARRARHLRMRRLSQTLTRDKGRVLYLEDDGIVPADVWSRLSALLDSGYAAVSGLQTSRHGGLRAPGLWLHRNGLWATVWPSEASPVDACGHFCLLTDGETYSRGFDLTGGEAIDRAHTQHLTPLGCDPDVVVGHLLDNGQVIREPEHLVAYRGIKEVARVKAVRSPAGTFWPDMHGKNYDPSIPYDDDGIQRVRPKEAPRVRDPRMYTVKGNVIIGGFVRAKRRHSIHLEEARALAMAGGMYADGPYAGLPMEADPELELPYEPVEPVRVEPVRFDPREEIKPIDPRTALKHVCRDCGRSFKSAAGLASHIKAGKC